MGVPAMRGGLWVHAVSVGETLAAVPLVEAWRKAHPDQSVFVSTMTPTGSARVRAAWGDQVQHGYAPYDLPWAWALFFRRVKPRVLVIMETELWPNMIQAAHQRHIPVILANARLSERSAKGYAKAAWLSRPMLAALSHIAAQDQGTATRFQSLGVSAECISVTGSLKFDIAPSADIGKRAAELSRAWQLEGRPVLVAASTHAGEDELVLSAFAEIRQHYAQALLILVPRHPERFDHVAALIKQKGFVLARRGHGESVSGQTQVLLGDTMGELLQWYALATVAFVGGSLVAVGGHNMLEPMVLNVPTLSGPYVFNFQSIADELVAQGALEIVQAEDMANACIALFSSPEKVAEQTQKAQAVLAANRGALQRQLTIIEAISV